MTAPAPAPTAGPGTGEKPVAPGPPPGWAARLGGVGVLLLLAAAVVLVGLWHLTQGTSGLGAGDLLRALTGQDVSAGGVSSADIVWGSRLPRLAAGIAVGIALGAAGMLLQTVTRNPLASPDTLAVAAGAYFTLTAAAVLGLSVPLWASTGVAFAGGLLAAAIVLGLTGLGAGTSTTRLILAGSAVALGLDSLTAMLLILFKERTTGLFAWGSGSLAQLNLDAAARSAPLIALVLVVALLLSRRLDLLALGEDAAATLGVPVRATRTLTVLCAVLLTATSVTLAGPIGFVGLGAPVLARLLAHPVPALRRHAFGVPAAGLLGALVVLLADVGLRAVLGAEAAASIPTGIPTAALGGILIVVLARRLPDAHGARFERTARSELRTRRRFVVVLVTVAVLLAAAVVVGLLAGSLWLRLGDLGLWVQHTAPDLVARALDERLARVLAATLAGGALALAGTAVQATVRNPLAEPGLLGVTAGAGLGAVVVVTSGLGGRTALVTAAVTASLLTFVLIAALAWRGGLPPDRFVLVGIGSGYTLSAATTFLLLRSDPYDTPRILTWLSGTTYGRTLPDVVPVAVVLAIALPVLLMMRRELDLLAVDEDTPRILGLEPSRIRPRVLALAAVLTAVSVVAVGTIGFVGLVAPHLARSLVGARHGRILWVAMLLGGLLVLVADTLGRTVIAPSQIPAGLVTACIGAPYFVWLLRRTRG